MYVTAQIIIIMRPNTVGIAMRGTSLLLLCFLWSLVEVHSQTEYPYVSFMGEALPNHSYVDLSLVGNDENGTDSVQCHTDMESCCNANYGIHRGNWIPPDSEVRLPFVSESGDIVERREHKRVDLRRNNADMPSGIYRCNIPTEAVHDDNKTSLGESVYMGLYASGGIANTLQF